MESEGRESPTMTSGEQKGGKGGQNVSEDNDVVVVERETQDV